MDIHNYLISIAMPVYNVQNTIVPALRSILHQTHENWECIVIDDGSTDNTREIIQSFKDSRIRIFADGFHKTLPVRLNEAILLSKGSYFARMDGDDVAYPQRLQRQLSYLERHPEVELVGAGIVVFGKDGEAFGKRQGVLSETTWRYRYGLQTVPLAHPTFMGRINWFRRHPYPEWPSHFQDQQLLLAALGDGGLAVLPEILLGYREEGLTMEKQFRYRGCYFKVFKHLRRTLGLAAAISILFVQGLKLFLDYIAIFTGLKYSLLRNRAAPMNFDEEKEWYQVWQAVNMTYRSMS
jgi:glycosyltransferase involved in cell wall biosynthesis